MMKVGLKKVNQMRSYLILTVLNLVIVVLSIDLVKKKVGIKIIIMLDNLLSLSLYKEDRE